MSSSDFLGTVTALLAKRKNDDTAVPPSPASVEDIMKALLATPPPAGHPATRKKRPRPRRNAARRGAEKVQRGRP